MAVVPNQETSIVLHEETPFTIPCIHLLGNQVGVSQFLRLAYMQGIKDVDITTKIRKDAHEARMLHLTSVDLMRQFSKTSSNVLGQIMPGIRLGIEKRNDELIAAFLNLMKEWTEKMKKEAIDTRESYKTLQTTVSEHGSVVRQAKSKKVTERKQAEASKEEEEDQINLYKKQSAKVKSQQKYLEKKSEDTAKQMEELVSSLTAKNVKKEDNSNIFWRAVKQIVSFFPNLITVSSEKKKLETVQKLSQLEETMVKQTAELTTKERELEQKKLTAVHKVKNLSRTLTDDFQFEMESLDGVASCLSKVESALTDMIEFWSVVTGSLRDLAESGETGGRFLPFIRTQEGVLPVLIERINEVEQSWKNFNGSCSNYLRISVESEARVDQLYSFLDGSIEEWPEEKRKHEIESLTQKFKQPKKALEQKPIIREIQ